MPKTKRNKVISLTATQRSASDRSEAKTTLLSSVQQCAQEYPYIWLFSLANARTAYLQEVRKLWKDSGRIFVGKNRVVAKALGEGVEDEVVKGVRGLSQRLTGSVGLLFTNSPPAEVSDWFATHERKDYARAGNVARSTVTLPEGPLYTRPSTEGTSPETLPGSLEPQLRKLGLPTELKRGVPTLLREHQVCTAGKRLDAQAAQILKHLLDQQASFRIIPLCYYSAAEEAVKDCELSEEEKDLVKMASGKDGEQLPGGRVKSGKKSQRQAAVGAKKAKAGHEEDEEFMDEDEGDDNEDDDDEDIDETGGDRVTESMMLPAHLR
ncbi:hypothetical protein BDZ90DRAFT_238222 [Jaminaea rosea]|uniref:Ribosome assembly factor mrt4 n=1 Tax=Jaminaea rosea TaxID=1569628 RepID=A0A316UV31_9BASI|nr:hypothetical protein BDZ90DRAFT_238222 [Jaminaea rosea]PWN29139.1 hypothetical protein BDZ90DRAFT_238222 [Jaminaea rosea]